MATEGTIPPSTEGVEEGPWYTSILFIVTVSIISLTLLLLLIYRKIVMILVKTFPRDVRSFDATAERFPNKVCFYFEDTEWTFSQVADYTNRVANYFQSQGYRKNDNVGIMMENRPEFVCTWLGLSKLGVVPALINYNLRLKPLLHSIQVVNSKAIIYGFELSEALRELSNEGLLPNNLPLYCSGHAGKSMTLDNSFDMDEGVKRNLGTNPVIKEVVGFQDNLVWIYTSGTTGLPKAAPIKHARYFFMTVGGHFMHDITENDIQYTALPLYHSAGGILGIGQALSYGTSVVIKKKFSATSFWKDCIRYKVTAAQYIGEICRYLYAQPESEFDKQHRVRIMYGLIHTMQYFHETEMHENCLYLQKIWKAFVERFGISRIGELYGSTEGNCNTINIDSKIGAVGFFPRLAYPLLPTCLVKVNQETGEILRNPKNNHVIACKPNEAGELIGKIVIGNPLRDFQGYADPAAKEKKIIRNAFREGDAWFRSGDILVMDEYGYFYFKDRTGDTFRWKGENCSTAEVESVISCVGKVTDSVVYGVQVPGNEGRCAMAAIADPDEELDMDALAVAVNKSLPPYARPYFVRLLKAVETTGTYKLRKVDLQKEGYNIDNIQDKIYFYKNSKYIPLEQELYSKLMSGSLRL